jgi:PII-like signaling protein
MSEQETARIWYMETEKTDKGIKIKEETEAVLLRIFIGESDNYQNKPLYKYLVELFRREGLAGATVLRGITGYGKKSIIHTTSILRLSTDMPIIIEVTDTRENIEKIKPLLNEIIEEGLITEEKVKIIQYRCRKI